MPDEAELQTERVLPQRMGVFQGWLIGQLSAVFAPRHFLREVSPRLKVQSSALIYMTAIALAEGLVAVVMLTVQDSWRQALAMVQQNTLQAAGPAILAVCVPGLAATIAGYFTGFAVAGGRSTADARAAGFAQAAFTMSWVPVLCLAGVAGTLGYGIIEHGLLREIIFRAAFLGIGLGLLGWAFWIIHVAGVIQSARYYEARHPGAAIARPDEPMCEQCGYLLVNANAAGRCSECGTEVRMSLAENPRALLPTDAGITFAGLWLLLRSSLAFPLKTARTMVVRSHFAQARRLWVVWAVINAAIPVVGIATYCGLSMGLRYSRGGLWSPQPGEYWTLAGPLTYVMFLPSVLLVSLAAFVVTLIFPTVAAMRCQICPSNYGPRMGPMFRAMALSPAPLLLANVLATSLRVCYGLLNELIDRGGYPVAGQSVAVISICVLVAGLVWAVVAAYGMARQVRFAAR